VLVSFLFTEESFVLGVSDGGELIESGLSIDLVFLVNTEVNFSSGERGGAGLVMDLSSVESVITISNFFGSESNLFSTVSLLDGPHSVVFSLLSSDLFVESLNGIEDSGEWSTHGDLGLDLSEERSVRELAHSLESLLFDGHCVGGNEDDGKKGEYFHCY
jgi:hypothetical protein